MSNCSKHQLIKIAFLDRDGTINKDVGYVGSVKRFQFIPGAISGLKQLYNDGFHLVIITNQSGIARGYYSINDYYNLNRWMCLELEKEGVHIDKTLFCPHLIGSNIAEFNKKCDCRKPKTGLFYKAINEYLSSGYTVDNKLSCAIGDSPRDLTICDEIGCKGILISSSKQSDYLQAKNLAEAARIIVESEGSNKCQNSMVQH